MIVIEGLAFTYLALETSVLNSPTALFKRWILDNEALLNDRGTNDLITPFLSPLGIAPCREC